MAKSYRTANGGKVDLGALILSQENTRSVGNMSVNAKGDRINSRNEVVETRNEIVQTQYDRAHSTSVQESPIPTSAKDAEHIAREEATAVKRALAVTPVKAKAKAKAKSIKEEILPVATKKTAPTVEKEVVTPVTAPIPVPVVEKKVQQEEVVTIPKNTVPQGGLAAAIAKAKQIKEEQLKTPREIEQEKKGVNKI